MPITTTQADCETYVAKGATVITQERNKQFFEKVSARPRTITPDMLSKSPGTPAFDTVADKKVLTDGTETIEIHWMKGTSHNVANMPNEKLVYWGGGYNPPEGNDPRDSAGKSINPYTAVSTTAAKTAFGRFASTPVRNNRQRASVNEAKTRASGVRPPAMSFTADCDKPPATG